MDKKSQGNAIVSFATSVVVFIAAVSVAIIPAYLVGETYKAVGNNDGGLIAYGVFAMLFMLCMFIFHNLAKNIMR